jgi:hypothetical protein
MERFLGQNVRISLKSPSGAQVIWPVGKLVYSEGKREKPGFYMEGGFGLRLRTYQLIGTSIDFSSKGRPLPMLSFDVGIPPQYLEIAYNSIKGASNN